jgi:hypothetical protein
VYFRNPYSVQKEILKLFVGSNGSLFGIALFFFIGTGSTQTKGQNRKERGRTLRETDVNAPRMLDDGRPTFRFDTCGDEALWGDRLQLHRAIEGAKLGDVGSGISLNRNLL